MLGAILLGLLGLGLIAYSLVRIYRSERKRP